MPVLLGDVVTPPQKDSTSLLSIVDSLSSSSSSDSPTIVTFSRPLNPTVDDYTTAANYELKREINQGVIFAKGDENPGSEKQDSDLKQHSLDSMGGSYVDLSVEFKSDSAAVDAPLTPVKGESSTLPTGRGGSSSSESTSEGGSTPTAKGDSDNTPISSSGGNTKSTATVTGSTSAAESSSTNSGSSSTNATGTSSSISADGGALSYANVIKIHAICAASAWLFFAPLGVLYARFGRGAPGTTLFKFPWHFFQQTWITAPLTLGAVGLAYYATTLKASTTKSGHQTLGFTFAALLLLQVFLGWWTHESHEPLKPGEPPPPRALKAWLHIIIGISLIGLGFVQVRLGMEKYGATDKIYQLGYWAAVVLFSIIYLGSLLFTVLNPPTATTPSLPHHHHRHQKKHRHRPRHHEQHALEHKLLRGKKSHSHSGHRKRERKKKKRRKDEHSSENDDTETGSDSSSDSD